MKRISAVARGVAAVSLAALLHASGAFAQLSAATAPAAQAGPTIAGIDPIYSSPFPIEGWASRTAMPAGRWAHAIASFTTGTYPANNAYIYVIAGGDSSFANTSAVARYDVSADTWSALAPMTPSRMQIGAARIGGKIYVPSGYASSFSPTTTLSIYDIAADQWQNGASIPVATGDYAIGAYADRYVYVIGGYSGSGDLNTVQVYDTVMDAWQSATPKPGTATAGLRGAIAGNRIVVVGGYSQTTATEISDAYVGTIDASNPAIITWAPIAAYPGGTVGRLGAGAPVSAGPAQGAAGMNLVFFTGGDPDGQGVQVKGDTWIYDLNEGIWKTGPNKPAAVSNICDIAGVSSGGKLHMVSTGGYDGVGIIAVNQWLTLGYEVPPDLALTASTPESVVDEGTTLVYTLTYSVGAPGAADAVIISDTVPSGTTFNAAASSPGWSCTPDINAGSVCTIALGTLAESSTGSVLFAVDTSNPPQPAGATQIDNSAVIGAAAPFGPEQNLANNTTSVSTPYSTRIFADGFEGP